MNNAQFHLFVNHLPVAGLLIGTAVLLAGLILEKAQVKLTGMAILVFSSFATALAFSSGRGAEKLVNNISGFSETLINRHLELATELIYIIVVLGIFSIIGLAATIKKSRYAEIIAVICLLIAITSGIMAKKVEKSGSEIRHTEVRKETRIILLQDEKKQNEQ